MPVIRILVLFMNNVFKNKLFGIAVDLEVLIALFVVRS